MIDYLKNNLISFLALLVSFAGFGLSLKNYLKSNVKLKLSSNPNNSFYADFAWYQEYKLIILDLTIENNSTSAVDISRIKLVSENTSYLANPIHISDMRNKNGITLINDDNTECIRLNIDSENIMNSTRLTSLGTIHGYAVFNGVGLISKPKSFKLIVDTPSKSFKADVIVNLCPEGFRPINSLK